MRMVEIYNYLYNKFLQGGTKMSDKTKKSQAVGDIPSGFFIITVQNRKDDCLEGYLASWVQQLSFSPLLVSLAIKPDRPGYSQIVNKDVFTINIIGEDDKSCLKHFWKGYSPDNNPFSQIETKISSDGGVTITSARSAIHCRMVDKIQPGDHDIIIAEVIDSEIIHPESTTSIHLRKSGLDY